MLNSTNAKSIAELKSFTDEELISAHDRLSANTVVGVNYYLDELRQRMAKRSQDEMEKLTARIYWLTVAVAIATAVQLAIALMPLF